MVIKSTSKIKTKTKIKTKSKTKSKISVKKKFLNKKKIGLGLTSAGLLGYYLYKNKNKDKNTLIEKIKKLSLKDIFGDETGDYNQYLSDFKLDPSEVLKYNEFVFINGKKRSIPPSKEYTEKLDKKININTNTDFMNYVNTLRKKRGYKAIDIPEFKKNFINRNKNNIKKINSLKILLSKSDDYKEKKEIQFKINTLKKTIDSDIRLILYPYSTINKFFVKSRNQYEDYCITISNNSKLPYDLNLRKLPLSYRTIPISININEQMFKIHKGNKKVQGKFNISGNIITIQNKDFINVLNSIIPKGYEYLRLPEDYKFDIIYNDNTYPKSEQKIIIGRYEILYYLTKTKCIL